MNTYKAFTGAKFEKEQCSCSPPAWSTDKQLGTSAATRAFVLCTSNCCKTRPE